ncbi:MAG: vWA domain-containing protein [Planctomycetota bacterium]|jgi:hypothetical protein
MMRHIALALAALALFAAAVPPAFSQDGDQQKVWKAVEALQMELSRGEGGQSERMVRAKVLDDCVASLRTVSEQRALMLIVEELNKAIRGKQSRLAYYLAKGINFAATGKYRKQILKLLDCKDIMVQMGILEALMFEGARTSIDTYFKILTDRNRRWEVKKVALKAIEKHFEPGDTEMVGRLVEAAKKQPDKHVRIKSDIRDLLQRMTAKKESGGNGGGGAPRPERQTVAEFFGIPTESKRVIFILDRTGSMKDPCSVEEEEKKDKGVATKGSKEPDKDQKRKMEAEDLRDKWAGTEVRTKMDALKREYITTVYDLPEDVYFTTIWYNEETTVWKEKLVRATWENKLSAMALCDQLDPKGGTNIWDALEIAFQLSDKAKKEQFRDAEEEVKEEQKAKEEKERRRKEDRKRNEELRKVRKDKGFKEYLKERNKLREKDKKKRDQEWKRGKAEEQKKRNGNGNGRPVPTGDGYAVPQDGGPDTIYLLTDGRPNRGKITSPEGILAELKKLNELRKITIHTICLGDPGEGRDPPDPDFLRKMAEENGGKFRHVSAKAGG